jgi:ABC-type glycerol-3-phosphate transport system permease component
MDYLAQRKLIVPDTRKSLLGNRLVMVVPSASTATVALKPGFDMRALLGADGRWVTGDPSGVPVGRYAREALTKLGVWDFAQTRLVRAENVRVALALSSVAKRLPASSTRPMRRSRRRSGCRCVPRRQLRASQLPGRDRRRQGQRGCARLLRFLESPEAHAIFKNTDSAFAEPERARLDQPDRRVELASRFRVFPMILEHRRSTDASVLRQSLVLGCDADSTELVALRLSLQVATIAVACSLPLAIFVAWHLARFDFPGKTMVDAVVHLPLVLPPVVIGYFLLVLFGTKGRSAAGCTKPSASG